MRYSHIAVAQVWLENNRISILNCKGSIKCFLFQPSLNMLVDSMLCTLSRCLRPTFAPPPVCFSVSSGSDSPDQALEAEEIVKQLDMEQSVETPTCTATSTQEVCAISNFNCSISQLPPLRPQHIPEVSPLAEEGELDADADLPPLTGTYCSCGSERMKNLMATISSDQCSYFSFFFPCCGF